MNSLERKSASRGETDDSHNTGEIIEESRIRARLPLVHEIESRLRSSSRVPIDDREILATNLGSAFMVSEHQGLKLSHRKLFTAVFGEEIGESKLKKRKNFMLLPGESPQLGGDGSPRLTASGRDYLELAIGLARLSPRSTDPEERAISILKLVRGSSFDNQEMQFEQGQIAEIRRASRIIKSCVNEKDLVRYGELLKRLPPQLVDDLRAELDNGRGYISEDFFGDVSIEGDFHGYSGAILAPQVQIGMLWLPINSKVRSIRWGLAPNDLIGAIRAQHPVIPSEFADDERLQSLIKQYVSAGDETEKYEIEDSIFSDWICELQNWGEDDHWEEQLAESWYEEDDHISLCFPAAVQLQLRYHSDLDRWLPFLYVRPVRNRWEYPYDQPRFIDHYSKEAHLMSQYLANDYVFGCDEQGSFAYLAKCEWCDSYEDSSKDFEIPDQLGFGCFALDDHGSHKVLTALLGQKVTFEGLKQGDEDWSAGPLPSNTIGAELLANLAFADVEKAIPTLLAQDFLQKYEIIERVFNEGMRSYQSGIARWE